MYSAYETINGVYENTSRPNYPTGRAGGPQPEKTTKEVKKGRTFDQYCKDMGYDGNA